MYFVVLSRHLVFSCRCVGLRLVTWEVSPVYPLLCTDLVSYPVSIVMQDLVNDCATARLEGQRTKDFLVALCIKNNSRSRTL
jgi:hypothetical protein